MGSPFPNLHDFRRAKFPSLPRLFGEPSKYRARQIQTRTSPLLYSVFASYSTLAPFLPRLVATSALNLPMFTVSLQRNTVDIGGVGMLSIGELPSGIADDNMTWVPLRMYSYDEGGMPAPPNSPTEVCFPTVLSISVKLIFSIRGLSHYMGNHVGWRLPRRRKTSTFFLVLFDYRAICVDRYSGFFFYSSVVSLHKYSLLQGNSLLRGPSDVVELIYSRLGTDGIFPCSEPHTLAFEIGGKMFPVDPRDFASQAFPNDVQRCNANLVSTDTPRVGGYQFGWSLGVPFLKR